MVVFFFKSVSFEKNKNGRQNGIFFNIKNLMMLDCFVISVDGGKKIYM
jgi:hypothetical protein